MDEHCHTTGCQLHQRHGGPCRIYRVMTMTDEEKKPGMEWKEVRKELERIQDDLEKETNEEIAKLIPKELTSLGKVHFEIFRKTRLAKLKQDIDRVVVEEFIIPNEKIIKALEDLGIEFELVELKREYKESEDEKNVQALALALAARGFDGGKKIDPPFGAPFPTEELRELERVAKSKNDTAPIKVFEVIDPPFVLGRKKEEE